MNYRNVGVTDRIGRLVIAGLFFSAFAFLPMPTALLGLIGLVPLLTALAGFCPLYRLFGFSTCRLNKD